MLRSLQRQGSAADQAQATLRAYAERMSASPRPDYRRYADTLREYNCAVAADVHNGATTPQRQFLAAKLKGWETDLRALAAAE